MSAAVLLIQYEGWDVCCCGWSAAAAHGDGNTQLCYPWGANWISFIDSATGIAKVTLDMPFTEFLRAIRTGGIVDLRHVTARSN